MGGAMFENAPAARYIASCVVPLVWMVVSSGLILLNKHLMSNIGFKYPMAISSLGQIFSAFAAFMVCRVFKWVHTDKVLSARFYAFNVIPIGFFMALTLMAGNAVYMYLSVAFIQMLKAFTPVFTMVGLFCAGLESPKLALILSVCVIAFGTAVAGYGEINFSLVGVLLMTVSEACEATRLVMTQFMLQGLKFHPIEGVMFLAPACVVWMVLGVWLFEYEAMVKRGAFALVTTHWLAFTGAATLGFAVNVLVFFTIQLCGSLTLKVLGTTKNAGLVVFCVIFLHERVTLVQGTGYVLALAGFAWYQHGKLVPEKEASAKNDMLDAIPLTRNASNATKSFERHSSLELDESTPLHARGASRR